MKRIVPNTLAAVAASLFLLPATPRAQQALPDTIVTATRIPTPVERVPAAVTVIDRREIEERGLNTLTEALSTVPGMNLVQLGGPGQQASAFLRGTNARHVLVLLDGVPVNDPSDPAGAFNFGNELLFDVERIEVVRGPASALYGSGALGGVVNIVTRRAAQGVPVQAFGELAGGTQNTLRGGGGVTGQLEQFDYLVSGNSLTTRGFNTIAPRIQGQQGERDGLRSNTGTARLGWTPQEGTRVEGLLRWRENHFGLDNIPQDDPNYSGQDRRVTGQLRGETRLADWFTTGLRLARTEDRRSYRNLPDGLSDSSLAERHRGTRSVLDWGNTVRLPTAGPLDAGALNFGITHALEEVRSSTGIFDSVSSYSATARAQQHTTAGFGSLQYRLWERLDLSAGLRHDSVSGFTDATTWRLGGVLALPEIRSRVRAAVGTAFAAPSLEQRYGISVVDFLGFSSVFQGNPALKPERSTAWEAGAETDVPAFGKDNFATPGFTWFQSTVRDLITSNADFTTYVNVRRANIHGAEMFVTLRPSPWLDFRSSWTITEAIDADTKLRLPRRPEHVASFTARVTPLPKLVVAPTVQFTGRTNDDATYDNQGNFLGRGVTKSGTLFHLTASYRVLENATLFVEGRNLTNSRWEPANGFVTPGRSVLFGTRFSL